MQPVAPSSFKEFLGKGKKKVNTLVDQENKRTKTQAQEKKKDRKKVSSTPTPYGTQKRFRPGNHGAKTKIIGVAGSW